MTTEALLFQTGYLTIEAEEQLSGVWFYRLRWPNREVYQTLNTVLLDAWTDGSTTDARSRRSLHQLLLANDFAGLERFFSALFAGIPNDWYRNNPIARYEGYYASVFYAVFASLGLDLTLEESSNAGRLDMALRFNAQVYLFEFKVMELAPEGRALQQIKTAGYADRYLGDGRPIHLIGLEFSRERGTLVGFEVETVQPKKSS
jgi:hypothetical protein